MLRTYQKKWRQKLREDKQRWLLSQIKQRAAKRGLECDLKLHHIAELIQTRPTFCPVFPNISLSYTVGLMSDNHAEIDRINNDKGYVVGNVRFISRRANRIKSDATAQELYWLWLDAQKTQQVEAF